MGKSLEINLENGHQKVLGSFQFVPPSQYIMQVSCQKWHVCLVVANNMRPLCWGAQTEMIQVLIINMIKLEIFS